VHEVILSNSGHASRTNRLPLCQVAVNGVTAWQRVVNEAIKLFLLGFFCVGSSKRKKTQPFQADSPFCSPHTIIPVSPAMLLKYFFLPATAAIIHEMSLSLCVVRERRAGPPKGEQPSASLLHLQVPRYCIQARVEAKITRKRLPGYPALVSLGL